jgi:hypothetical protein
MGNNLELKIIPGQVLASALRLLNNSSDYQEIVK